MRATPRPTSRSTGSTRRGRHANPRAMPSAPRRPSSCAGSSPRRTAGCGGCSASSGAACRRPWSARRPASRHGSLPRWVATWRSRPRWARRARGIADPTDAAAADAPRHGQAGGLRRPRAGRARRHDRRGDPGSADGPRPPPGIRDGRHLRRGVRRRDAVLLRDVCRRRLSPRGAAGRPQGRTRHRLRARSGSGRGSNSTTAPSRRPTRSVAPAGAR